ncbi:MAG TPA: phosphatase domain-containing protein [Cellulomonadaceae bacterium]|nr:phosphatase domain-containing protein [Cellulomonadaceae bacterium]
MTAGASRPTKSSRPHLAARVEDALYRRLAWWLRRRGWALRIEPFTCYGGAGWVRVLARTVLAPPGADRARSRSAPLRGWRRFAIAQLSGVAIEVEIAGERRRAVADRGGYVDSVVPSDLPSGWHTIRLSVSSTSGVVAHVLVVDPSARTGMVSDIDDTVMVTNVPRPLLAAWNALVRDENARQPVPGMAVLYDRLTRDAPIAPVFYLSTGAWNSEPALVRFLHRHGYPRGPLLLTDWGPTQTGWFRSGREHKRAELRRLVHDFPTIAWLLVGDDGQHDPQLYRELANEHPDHVNAIVIRRLTPAQQVLAHGSTVASDASATVRDDPGAALRTPTVYGRDGTELRRLLAARSIALSDRADTP